MYEFTTLDSCWVCSESRPQLFDMLMQLISKPDDQRSGFSVVSFSNNLLTKTANSIFHSTQGHTVSQTILWRCQRGKTSGVSAIQYIPYFESALQAGDSKLCSGG